MSQYLGHIDESIETLRRLLDLLTSELEERTPRTGVLPMDAQLCKESMLTITVLLPKLRATRQVLTAEPRLEEPAPRYSLCANCDDT